MRIYFTANPQAELKLQARFVKIVDSLNAAGVLVMSNLAQSNLTGFSASDMERMSQAGEILLEKMDGIIIEGTKPMAESGYLIALALAHRKPILYLIEKGKIVDKNLVYLQQQKNSAEFLRLISYTDGNLEKSVSEFIHQTEQGVGSEVPSIKFTLRITPRIERYLQWRTNNTKLSKADFLRAMIEKLIDEDEGFKKFLADRRQGDE